MYIVNRSHVQQNHADIVHAHRYVQHSNGADR